jgi:hypothetical protein
VGGKVEGMELAVDGAAQFALLGQAQDSDAARAMAQAQAGGSR